MLRLLLILGLTSCGYYVKPDDEQENTRTHIKAVHGEDGEDGADGKDGADGSSCSVAEVDEGAIVTCGNESVLIKHGTDGQNGTDGKDGVDGTDGKDGKVIVKHKHKYKKKKRHKKKPNLKPEYVGYFCHRTVIKIGKTVYVIHGQLVPLTKHWVMVSNTCSLRLHKGKVRTQTGND